MVIPAYTKELAWGPMVVVRNIIKHLKKRGWDFTIYAANLFSPSKPANLPSFERFGGTLIKRYKVYLSIGSYHLTPSLLKDLLKDDFNLIHAHGSRSFQFHLAALTSKFTKKALILTAQGTLEAYLNIKDPWLRILHKISNIPLSYALKQARMVTALSDLEAKQYMYLFGVPKQKIAVIPNGIDESVYKNIQPPKCLFKAKYNLNDSDRIILYVGRLSHAKGIDFLIKSFAYFVKKYQNKSTKLVLAGPDDGYYEEAKALAKLLKIEDRIKFTGYLTEFEKLCAFVDSDIIVYPERFNVTLIAPLEALAFGKPVIISKENYLSQLFTAEDIGFTVSYGNVAAMSTLFEKILSEPDIVNKGKKARNFILKYFSWQEIALRYEEVYFRALTG